MMATGSMLADARAASAPGGRRRVSRPYFYRAYGLVIRSELRLPELDPADPGVADLIIRFAGTGREMPSGGAVFEFGRDTQYMAWESVGAFLIRGTSEIHIERAHGVGDRLLALPLLGPVMAILLHLRGRLVLHASAVAIGNRSAIFLGDKRAGKSTTAAAMVAAGHRLLTDDVLAVDVPSSGTGAILPGFPQIKLSNDSAEAVTIGSVVEPQLHPAIDKRQHRLTDGFSQAPVPVTRIYVLERGTKADVTKLPVQQAFLSLIRFSYVTRFDGAALKGDAAGAHLRHCAQLAGSAGVRRLQVPAGLDQLGEAVRLIEQDLAEAGRTG